MNTSLVSQKTLDLIEDYRNFKIGQAICSVPYFNNRTVGLRAGLKGEIGKGTPLDILEEIKHRAIQNKIKIEEFDSENLKKFLVDENVGIDCSGFAYYLLNCESIEKGKGALDRHLSFPLCKGILGKMKCKLRPVENADVATLADNSNSKNIELKDIKPGDMITLLGGPEGGERDHILVVHQIEYQNFIPITIHYIHAIAWPSDGVYGHGIHEGKIEIMDLNKNLLEQKWTELGKSDSENYTLARARVSQTEIRRLKWF